MNYPQELSYTKSHEWVKLTGDTAIVGLTEYAQHSLGDLVFIDLPQVGVETEAGKSFANVESVKAVSDVFCPVTGTVAEVNEALMDAPEMINSDPYGAWIAKIENIGGKMELMDAAEYARFVEAEGK
jgi:glycine cleavage system H protein